MFLNIMQGVNHFSQGVNPPIPRANTALVWIPSYIQLVNLPVQVQVHELQSHFESKSVIESQKSVADNNVNQLGQ